MKSASEQMEEMGVNTMALSGYEERVIADLERQFAPGDRLVRLRRRVGYRLACECIVAFAGISVCPFGLVLWWPAAVIAVSFVAVAPLSFASDLSRNRRWIRRDALQRCEHRWRCLLAGVAAIRRTLAL